MASDMVETVRGPIRGEDLGRTQMHEHILKDTYSAYSGFGQILDDVEVAVEELGRFHELGGGTMVELSLPGGGRNPAGLRRVSEESGVHIVMGTGFLWGSAYTGLSAVVKEKTTSELAGMMERDLTIGTDVHGIRAGVIGEVYSRSARGAGGENYLSPEEERLHRAAARAHKATGALIYTDTFHGELALEQIGIMREEGVSLSRVVIGHLGDRRDLDYYLRIAQTGANLGVDHVGMLSCAPDAWRAKTILALCERGFVSQIVLSMDVGQRSYWRCMGGIGYDYLLREFVPLLISYGVNNEWIETMLVANPMRLLPFQT